MRFAVRLVALLALILAPVSGAHAATHFATDGYQAGVHLLARGVVIGHGVGHGSVDGDFADADQPAGDRPDTTDCMSAPCAATGIIPAAGSLPGFGPQQRLPLAAHLGHLGRSVAPPFDPPRTAG